MNIKNPIKIAARKSELAQIQARLVGKALAAKFNNIQIEYQFRESSGDQDLTTPLWQMAGRGVFTEDFYKEIINKNCDLVVHSWKDLPIEPRLNTKVMGVLNREDVRDVLLLPKVTVDNWHLVKELTILTSSPRRIFNLKDFLENILPQPNNQKTDIKFENIRGNVPTRLSKIFLAQKPTGVIIAKAALDRLSEHSAGFVSELKKCFFIVLPVTVNPPAPAQGSLAVEYLAENKYIELLLKTIQSLDEPHVILERSFLAGYGGGCHQKIGAYSFSRSYGDLFIAKGVSDSGELINVLKIESKNIPPLAKSESEIFPADAKSASEIFKRTPIEVTNSILKDDLLIARANAWPAGFKQNSDSVVWSSGVKTWIQLALKGVWVNGTLDSMGESELPDLELLAGRSVQFTKLTHSASDDIAQNALKTVATYRIQKQANLEDLSSKTHFYWASGNLFLAAINEYPQIIGRGYHSSGPGKTFSVINKIINDPKRVSVFLNHSQWKNFVLTKKP